MSWYAGYYIRARKLRERNDCLGRLVQLSFFTVCFIELAILSLATYVYINYVLCMLTSNIQAAIYLVVYTWLTVLCAWSWVQTIIHRTSRVPPQYEVDEETDAKLKAVTPMDANGRYRIEESNGEQTQAQLRILDAAAAARGHLFAECDMAGRARYCFDCRILKPDRTHHCSSCGFCAVRFDHHCPFINTCIHYDNYKYFVLFLVYLEAWVLCCWITSAEAVVRWFTDKPPPHMEGVEAIILMCIMIASQLASSIWPLGGLMVYHWDLITKNETTCEQAKIPVIRGDASASYKMAALDNIKVIMGGGLSSLWPVGARVSRTDGCHHNIIYSPTAEETCKLALQVEDIVEEGGGWNRDAAGDDFSLSSSFTSSPLPLPRPPANTPLGHRSFTPSPISPMHTP